MFYLFPEHHWPCWSTRPAASGNGARVRLIAGLESQSPSGLFGANRMRFGAGFVECCPQIANGEALAYLFPGIGQADGHSNLGLRYFYLLLKFRLVIEIGHYLFALGYVLPAYNLQLFADFTANRGGL